MTYCPFQFNLKKRHFKQRLKRSAHYSLFLRLILMQFYIVIKTYNLKMITMKKQSNYPLIEMSKQEVSNLVKEEKETLAVEYTGIKSFGTVDLWNIERQRKSRTQKRMFSLYSL